MGLVCSKDPERQAGSSVTTGRVFHVGHVKGNDPEEKRYPGPPGWGLDVKKTTSPTKKLTSNKNLRDASDGNIRMEADGGQVRFQMRLQPHK